MRLVKTPECRADSAQCPNQSLNTLGKLSQEWQSQLIAVQKHVGEPHHVQFRSSDFPITLEGKQNYYRPLSLCGCLLHSIFIALDKCA